MFSERREKKSGYGKEKHKCSCLTSRPYGCRDDERKTNSYLLPKRAKLPCSQVSPRFLSEPR